MFQFDLGTYLPVTVMAGAALTVLLFVVFWIPQGRRLMKESGYVPPRPTFWVQAIIYAVSRIVALFKAGEIEVVDTPGWRQALADESRVRYVVIANHQLFQDALVLGK